MESLRGRDEGLLAAKLRGCTLRELAREVDLTPEGVRLAIVRESRLQIDELELQLLAATKTGEVVAFVIPDHGGPDFETAINYLSWCVRELTERDIEIRVHYRPNENGVVIGLEDVTQTRRTPS